MSDMVLPLTADDIAAASNGQVVAGDPRIELLLDGAYAAVAALCGWHVTPSLTHTLVLDGTGGKFLNLPSMHVTDVSEVRVNGEPVAGYTWSEAGLLALDQGVFPDRFRSVQVTMTDGYKSAPAVVAVIQSMVLGALASPMGATREQAGSISVTWGRAGPSLNASDRAALAPYTLQSWG